MKKCLLSVAMIVKDEEHNIRRALESVKDVVDEIVVVDTGSKDRTPEIAREYTDKLYFHEWRNDFSEARNFSLQFPTCEWVLILDADEEASQEFREKIRDFLEKLPPDVNTVYIPILSYLDWDFKRTDIASVPRIFRNGTVYFKNVVHNQAIYKPKVVHAPFLLYHYGYIWTRKLKRQKYDRTATLIREHLKSVGDPIEKIYYLVQLYKTEAIGGKEFEANKIAWETLKEMQKVKEIPPIGLELLYLFGLKLIVEGFLERGKQLMELALKAFPNNPDPHFGMVVYHERKKDWEGVLEWGEKFLNVLERALSRKEEYVFTLMSIKEVGMAHLLMCHACVKLARMEEALEHLLKAIENRVDPSKLSYTLKVLAEIEDKDLFEKALPLVEELAKHVDTLSFDPVVEKMAEFNLKVPEELLNKLKVSSRIASLAIERLKTGRDMLYEYLTGGDLEGFLKRTGLPGLLTVYDVLRTRESEARLIRTLSRVEGDERITGVVQALIGDLYLKLGNFQEAISRYKKAIETLPEIARFVKPVIEDLKTKLDPETEGVFEELYSYFTGKREFLLDIPAMFREEAGKLHLISEHPLALYTSAVVVANKDKEKAKRLLEKISDPKRFPFFHYRLAKLHEEDDPKRAFELHLKAVEENENLADIALGRYLYTGLYPNVTTSFMREEDETVWVGNVSEKFSTLGVVHPVRVWKRGKDFYYCVPFPAEEALKMYREREEEVYKRPPFRVDERTTMEVLATLDVDELRVYPEDARIERLLRENDIEANPSSENLLIVSGVEQEPDLTRLLRGSRRVFLFFFSPNPVEREDPVWYYPAFRILRTPRQVRKVLEEAGYEIERLERKGEGLFFLEAIRRKS